jgi:hypothetical protein
MAELVFLKLGGSLITDKLGESAAARIRRSSEVRTALNKRPGLRLILATAADRSGMWSPAGMARAKACGGPRLGRALPR